MGPPKIPHVGKGHSGVAGNEMADYRTKEGAIRGKLLRMPSIATPAGIRQAFKINQKNRQVAEWDRKALKGLIYLYR